jgi:Na+/H+-translocating membrane pyrophosphatase
MHLQVLRCCFSGVGYDGYNRNAIAIDAFGPIADNAVELPK